MTIYGTEETQENGAGKIETFYKKKCFYSKHDQIRKSFVKSYIQGVQQYCIGQKHRQYSRSDKRKIKVFEKQCWKRKRKIPRADWADSVKNEDLQIRTNETKSIWNKQLGKGEKSGKDCNEIRSTDDNGIRRKNRRKRQKRQSKNLIYKTNRRI